MKGKKHWFVYTGNCILVFAFVFGALTVSYLGATGKLFYEHVRTPIEEKTTFRLELEANSLKLQGQLPTPPQKP
jgi:hypothetical protein